MKPMLAKPFEERLVPSFRFAQPKLDGMRLLWDGENIISRNGKEVPGIPSILHELKTKFKGIPLDGELYCHGMGFQTIISHVRRTVNIKENPNIKYHVFDYPLQLSFDTRFNQLCKLIHELQPELIVPVSTINVSDILIDKLDIFNVEGYEGTMIRNGHSLYQEKRTKDLLKIKGELDCELIIERCIEGEGKHLGRLGAFECIMKDMPLDIYVKVGTGFNDSQREQFWINKDKMKGKIITITFQEFTDGGVPRFPRFKSIRDYE